MKKEYLKIFKYTMWYSHNKYYTTIYLVRKYTVEDDEVRTQRKA